MAGSKTVCTLLNKTCHCGTYQKLRQAVNGIEPRIPPEDNMLLHKCVKGPNLGTSLAWDNFDVRIKHFVDLNHYTVPLYTISL